MRKQLLCTLVILCGCAEDLSNDLADDGGEEGGGAQVENVDEGDVTRTIVDATVGDVWVWFDLESRAQVEVGAPLESDAWDLGFQRFNIAINGGTSGGGGMEALVLEGTSLAEVTSVQNGNWITDAPDGEDQGDDPDYALGDWYDYDFMTHVLSPMPVVYVVRSVEGNAFAIEVVDYYDDAGVSGWMQIRWKAIEG